MPWTLPRWLPGTGSRPAPLSPAALEGLSPVVATGEIFLFYLIPPMNGGALAAEQIGEPRGYALDHQLKQGDAATVQFREHRMDIAAASPKGRPGAPPARPSAVVQVATIAPSPTAAPPRLRKERSRS